MIKKKKQTFTECKFEIVYKWGEQVSLTGGRDHEGEVQEMMELPESES